MARQAKQAKRVDDEHTANDVGQWGDKADGGNADYTRPFVVAGETVDLDALPAFGDDDESGSSSAKAPVRPS